MSLPGAVYDLSIPDLLHLLNEKITLECTRVREIGPPPAVSTASLESEVSVPRQIRLDEDLTMVNSVDRKPRNRNTRYPEVPALFAEHVATSQQVTAGDPLSHCRLFPGRVCRRCKVNHSADSRLPILARVHHLGSRKLDVGIQ